MTASIADQAYCTNLLEQFLTSNKVAPFLFTLLGRFSLFMCMFFSVRKNATHRESSREKSHVQEQSLMAGSNHQAGWGKMVQHRLWARRGFYRRGRLRKLAHARESLVEAGLS
jgi:hypothetical protein